jgi:UDP-N-acetylglucosamine--N-acetylmuramyl-(pentapeptide) pyrophosphoryl-undecaprenol N-acetylglucosamine transferase
LAREYGLDPLRPILVVVGGSLGAGKFNEVIAATKSNLLGIGVQIIHIVGKRNELPTSLPGYIPLTYLSNESMPKLYQGADLLITRAGAGTCMELAALGAFAILVPLAIGNGEQSQNAKFLVDAGAGIMIENGALTAQLLLENFETWISAAAAMRSDQKKISVSLHAAEIISDRLISTLDALGNRL